MFGLIKTSGEERVPIKHLTAVFLLKLKKKFHLNNFKFDSRYCPLVN